MPIQLRLFLGVLGLIFLVSCSSSKSGNNADALPDADADTQDSETVDDSDSQNSEIIDDSDAKPDVDADQDTDSSECQPSLSEAPFPYYDANGKITFCRPNCDTPTEDDPICIGNLWDEQNEKLCHEYPEYACCGTPCILESLKPMTKEEVDEMYTTNIAMHKCDLKINPWSWGYDASHGVVKAWNMNEGKVGFYMYPAEISYEKWSVGDKYVTYDIATQQYSFIIPARGQEQAYFKGKRLALISDKRSYDLNNENIFLAYIGDDGKTEIVYDKKVKSISYEPALNEKWAFVNLVDTNEKRMMYAKVGEWKWTSLGEGLGWKPSIVGDRLALYRDDFKGYICDLNKYPKNLDECYNVNNGEELRYIVLNKEDSNKVVYSSVQGKIVLMEYKNGKWNYSDLITSFSDEIAGKVNILGFIINMFNGNMLLYEEAFDMGSQSQIMANKLCYYNLKSKKAYCMKKMENDSEYDDIPVYPYGDAEFEGKWLLYQKINSTPLILRDMECYCNETSICPLEPATEEELSRKPLPLKPVASETTPEIMAKVEQEKILPKFDGDEVYFCTITERELHNFGKAGSCLTAAQMNKYLKLFDKSDQQLKDLILSSKRQWKTEKSFANLVVNHERIWEEWYGCPFHKEHFECEYDEMTSTFDSDSVMFATVIDKGIARDGIFFRDKFYEANGNFPKIIKELRQKFGASLRGMPRIEVKENKDGGVR